MQKIICNIEIVVWFIESSLWTHRKLNVFFIKWEIAQMNYNAFVEKMINIQKNLLDYIEKEDDVEEKYENHINF